MKDLGTLPDALFYYGLSLTLAGALVYIGIRYLNRNEARQEKREEKLDTILDKLTDRVTAQEVITARHDERIEGLEHQAIVKYGKR